MNLGITRKGGFFGWKRSTSQKMRIAFAILQAESCVSVAKIIREFRISEQTLYR